MSGGLHLHFVVFGPWGFATSAAQLTPPGTIVAPAFHDAVVEVWRQDGTHERRTIPCRLLRGETGRVWSDVEPGEAAP